MDEIRVILRRAPDDPLENDPEFQRELNDFSKSLRAAKVKFSQRAMAFDSVEALGYPLPNFLITLGPAVIAAVAGLCGAWVQAKYGRKVRLKIGDVEAEGRTIAEIEALLQKAKDFREDKPSD
jgi:hypothetical protein